MSLISIRVIDGLRLAASEQRHGFRIRPRQLSRWLMAARLLLVGVALAFAALPRAAAGVSSLRASQNEISPLEYGRPVERELAGGQTHTYQLSLQSNQYIRIAVEQKGVDVTLTLFGPDEQRLGEVSLPRTLQGRKVIVVVTAAAGNHRLEVRSFSKDAATGKYQAQITDLREATATDRARLALRQTADEANRLLAQRTTASLTAAVRKLEEALPQIRSIEDRWGEANALTILGAAYYSLSEYQKSIETFTPALALWREVEDGLRGQAVAIGYIANARSVLGEWEKVIEALRLALPVYQALGDRLGEAATLESIGVYYLRFGDQEKALEYFHLALPLRRAIGDRQSLAATLNNIGVAWGASGERQKAIEFYQQALALSRAVGDRRGEANRLEHLAFAYFRLGDKQAALDSLTQALALYRDARNRSGEAAVLRLFGNIYASSGEAQKALEHLNEALSLLRASEYGDRESEARTLYSLARTRRDLNQLSEAQEAIESAISLAEALRARIPDQQLRSVYSPFVRAYYDLYIDILMRQRHEGAATETTSLAFEASERARARSLLELLTEARVEIRQGVAPELLKRERELQQSLNVSAEQQIRLLNGRHMPEQAEAMAQQIKSLTARLQETRAQIRAASPRYAALTQPEPLSLKEIQEQLDADTLLLEYALGEEKSYLWAVTQTAISGYELPGRAEIEAAARQFYQLVKDPVKSEEATQAAARLSRMLLAPLAEKLTTKRLVIVADGALQYVPFAALPKPEVGIRKSEFGSRKQNREEGESKEESRKNSRRQPAEFRIPNSEFRLLIADHEIISLPSASTLAALRRELKGRAPAPKLVAVLADPVFDSNDVRLRRSAKEMIGLEKSIDQEVNARLVRSVKETGLANGAWPLPRLLGTRREATAILSLAPESQRKRALDFAANREAATSEDIGQYQIVHFATHGILNSRNPELSGIVLSLVDGQGRPQNGFLRLHEIYNLRLSAELVVLSACQTGLGKEIRGEGLIGLARGFMYAGAPRLVASLWQVDDKATGELMKRFYQGMLDRKLTAAAALRAAQIEMWRQKDWQSPYYWASFAIQGEWR
jgi:CHAT domain-containing protein